MSYLDVAVYPLKHPLLRLIYLWRHKAIAPGFGTLAKSCWNVRNPRSQIGRQWLRRRGKVERSLIWVFDSKFLKHFGLNLELLCLLIN
ncbi:hypothetical protein [Nostoc sp.]|uniref:hypothetical protein n=1 Tax=Nostoc sp. TaxID=1180 RepID=UPI002FF59DC9